VDTAGKAHVAQGGRGIQLCQSHAQAFGMLRLDARLNRLRTKGRGFKSCRARQTFNGLT